MRFTDFSFRSAALGTLGLLVLSGCSHVGQDDFDAEMAQIRAEMESGDEAVAERLGARVDDVEDRTMALEERMDALETALRTLEEEFDVTVERMETALRFNTPIHFGFDRHALTPEHEPLLERFSAVVGEYYPGALVTVEGFTDPAGSESYNLALGQRRADAVRDWLVGSGGLADGLVRSISYGEDTSRLVREGETGPGAAGRQNRRVVFVIDHADGELSRGIVAGSEM